MRCSFLTAFVVLAAAHNSVFVTASPIVASDSSGSDVTFCPCRYGGGPIVRPMPLGSDVRKRFISTDGSDDVRGRINETLDRLLSKLHQSDGSDPSNSQDDSNAATQSFSGSSQGDRNDTLAHVNAELNVGNMKKRTVEIDTNDPAGLFRYLRDVVRKLNHHNAGSTSSMKKKRTDDFVDSGNLSSPSSLLGHIVDSVHGGSDNEDDSSGAHVAVPILGTTVDVDHSGIDGDAPSAASSDDRNEDGDNSSGVQLEVPNLGTTTHIGKSGIHIHALSGQGKQ